MIGEIKLNRDALDELYNTYNRREYVHPDPLEFVHEYDDPADMEIVGLVASALAYGRVRQILSSVRNALERMGDPAGFVRDSSESEIRDAFHDFKHRFTTGADMAVMLSGAGRAIRRHGSLEACFACGLEASHDTVLPALSRFVCELLPGAGDCRCYLLPAPEAGSACKRLNLYLRWMVRDDDVDCGIWRSVPKSKLVIPLDTHMHGIAMQLGLTTRKAADLKTAVETTQAFRTIAPEDPVMYDFALTRLGIRSDTDRSGFLARWSREGVG